MRVRCIEPRIYSYPIKGRDLRAAICEGEVYEVEWEKEKFYHINGFKYLKTRFEVVEEGKDMAELKIIQILVNREKGATTILFEDKSVEVVKVHNEEFDLEKAVAVAVTQKVLGSRNKFKKLLEEAKGLKAKPKK